MLRAGVGMSIEGDSAVAAEKAAEAARAALGAATPDFAIVFATLPEPPAARTVLDAAAGVLGTRAIAGASAHGVMAAGLECEAQPSVAVLAATGAVAVPFLVEHVPGHEDAVAGDIAAWLPGGPQPEDLIVLLPDPRLDVALLSRRAHEVLGPARIVGAGAGDPTAAGAVQWGDGRVAAGAVAGVAIRGSRPARVGVTQACTPVTGVLTVTRAQGNWILELDGRPALDVYREAALGPLADDLARAAAFVLVALPRDDEHPLRPGGYLARHVVGFSPENRAFALPQEVRRGQPIALALREPNAARDDLKAMLAAAGPASGLGLYFNCCARGSAFFGVPGLEAAYIDSALGETPVAGMFGSCEIGPIGTGANATTELLTYTGVLALIE